MNEKHLNDRDTIEKSYNHPLLKDNKLDKRKSRFLFAILIFILFVQVLLVLLAIFYTPEPLDEILDYRIDVNVDEYGVMENTYTIKWRVLDSETDGPLTWVRIGLPRAPSSIESTLPNSNYSVRYALDDIDTYYARVDFSREYYEGEEVTFSFVTRHSGMAFERDGMAEFEFIPGWFDEIAIKNYQFSWNSDKVVTSNCDRTEGGRLVWEGALNAGQIRKLNIKYDKSAFPGVALKEYQRFNKETAISERRIEIIVFCAIAIFVLFIVQVLLLDSAIVYGRGRGFMPHRYYIYMNSSSHRGGRGGGGGGCACGCACACACAGGGRAGCSVKDFTFFKKQEDKTAEENSETANEKLDEIDA